MIALLLVLFGLGLLLMAMGRRSPRVAEGAIQSLTHPVLSWLGGPLLARIGAMVKLDSVAKIPSVSCPILLVRGTRDDLVSREMTDRLFAAAKPKVTFLPVEGAGHFDLFRAGGPRLWQAIGEWTSQTISSAAGAPAGKE